jgi:hypothetical protein
MRNGGSSFVILRLFCGHRLGSNGLVRIPGPRDNVMRTGEGLCRIGNTGNTATRITAKNGRGKNPERNRRETKASVRGGFKCLAHVLFPDARSVELCCNQPANPCSGVPSAASHFILASSVRTSIPRAGSSARNPSQRAFRARMKSMNVRSIPCG